MKNAKRQFNYGSEHDVQDYVHCMILDALTVVNHLLRDEDDANVLIARREASLFTNRPDHSVIMDSITGTSVLCIETKMPFNSNDKPVDGKVLGQVYDYVSWMRNLGHPNPFAVLTTFDQTWITWDVNDATCR